MKFVVIGGTGLIGKNLVQRLRAAGHEAVAASPSTGVNALTGEGLDAALRGTDTVVDVANSPSFEDAAVLSFFETSTRNLLRAEAGAGVRHHVALSVVGADRVPTSGYMRAKVAQETLITAGPTPYTIVRATQFFEFLGAIAGPGSEVRLPPALMQPIAADDVATALADVAPGPPVRGVVEVAGPEAIPMDAIVRRFLAATRDPRTVITDSRAQYFGAELDDRSLTPGKSPRLAPTRFEQWLGAYAAK